MTAANPSPNPPYWQPNLPTTTATPILFDYTQMLAYQLGRLVDVLERILTQLEEKKKDA